MEDVILWEDRECAGAGKANEEPTKANRREREERVAVACIVADRCYAREGEHEQALLRGGGLTVPSPRFAKSRVLYLARNERKR